MSIVGWQAYSTLVCFDIFMEEYNTAQLIVPIIGYLFWEYPASYIAQRLPIGTVVSSFV